ncbi:lasso peptide biosynthesis B2 protein [Streptomyces zhihengii]
MLLRCLPVRLVVRAARLAGRLPGRAASPEEADAVCTAVRRAAGWWPGRAACLEESLTAYLAAALIGRRVAWVLGARFAPQGAHAWIATTCGARAGTRRPGVAVPGCPYGGTVELSPPSPPQPPVWVMRCALHEAHARPGNRPHVPSPVAATRPPRRHGRHPAVRGQRRTPRQRPQRQLHHHGPAPAIPVGHSPAPGLAGRPARTAAHGTAPGRHRHRYRGRPVRHQGALPAVRLRPGRRPAARRAPRDHRHHDGRRRTLPDRRRHPGHHRSDRAAHRRHRRTSLPPRRHQRPARVLRQSRLVRPQRGREPGVEGRPPDGRRAHRRQHGPHRAARLRRHPRRPPPASASAAAPGRAPGRQRYRRPAPRTVPSATPWRTGDCGTPSSTTPPDGRPRWTSAPRRCAPGC